VVLVVVDDLVLVACVPVDAPPTHSSPSVTSLF